MAGRRDSKGRFVKGSRGIRHYARRAGGYVRRGYRALRARFSGYRMGVFGKLGLATIFFGPLLQALAGWSSGGVGGIFQFYKDSKANGKTAGDAVVATVQEFFDRLGIIWVGYKPSDGSTWDGSKGGGSAWSYVLAGGAMIAGDMLIAHVAKRATRRLSLPMIGQLIGSK